jgi:hypothetical protein
MEEEEGESVLTRVDCVADKVPPMVPLNVNDPESCVVLSVKVNFNEYVELPGSKVMGVIEEVLVVKAITGIFAPALPLLKSVSCTVAPPVGDFAFTETPGTLGVEVYVQFRKSARAWLAAAASKTIPAVR